MHVHIPINQEVNLPRNIQNLHTEITKNTKVYVDKKTKCHEDISTP